MKKFIKKLSALAFVGTASFCSTFLSTSQQAKAYPYPIPFNNGDTVKLQIANGQQVNMPDNQLFTGGWVGSYQPDNTNDWKFTIDGNGYGVTLHRGGHNITTKDLNPANGKELHAYPRGTTPYNGYSSWVLQPLGNDRYLVKWYNNQNYCMNIPGGIQNRRLTLWQCNSNDSDQVFTITNVNTTPPTNYVFPYQDGQIGAIEAANGIRIGIAANQQYNGGATGLFSSNDYTNARMEVKTNGYGYVIKKANSSYGLSSTTKTPSNGTQTHVYQSGYNGYQSFRLVDLGGGYYHWKFYEDTSKCLTVPLGGSVARPYLSDCNSSSSAQKLRLLQDSSNSSAKYFATLLAGYSTNSDGVLGLITGHSWVATSRFVKTVNSTSVVGGSVIRQSVEWTRDDSTINTFSTWPNSLTPLNPLDIVEKDVAYDLSTFKNYLNGARNYNDATRTVEISKAKYDNTTLNYDSIMGCSRYLIPSANAPGNCVCTTGALRMWKNLTNEDFTSLLYPKDVRNSIISTNQLQQKDQFDLPPL